MIENKENSVKSIMFKWYSIFALVGYVMVFLYNGIYWVGINFINEFEANVNYFKERADLKITNSKLGPAVAQEFSQADLNYYLLGQVLAAVLCVFGLLLIVRFGINSIGKILVWIGTIVGVFCSWYFVSLFFAPILIVFLVISALFSLTRDL